MDEVLGCVGSFEVVGYVVGNACDRSEGCAREGERVGRPLGRNVSCDRIAGDMCAGEICES